MGEYVLEKFVWSDSDFEVLQWHDARIWSFYSDPDKFRFFVDLDYIFSWVSPEPGESFSKFWISPVTMVFENVSDVKINLNSQQGTIEISEFSKGQSRNQPLSNLVDHLFRFNCQEGEMSLRSTGFKMFVRKNPVLQKAQNLSLDLRGGISFLMGRS